MASSVLEINTALERDVEMLQEANAAMKRRYDEITQENTRIRNSIFEQNINKQTYLFYTEHMAIRQIGLVTISLCLLALIGCAGTYSKGRYLISFLDFMAFLMCWRGIYVRENGIPMGIAVVVLLITLVIG